MEIRPAGLNERRCISRDELRLYGCVTTVATYTGAQRIFQSRPIEAFIKILRFCVERHPALRTVINGAESEKPTLAQAPTLTLTEHINVRPTSSQSDFAFRIQALLNEIQNIPLENAHVLPQWRIHITPLESSPGASISRFDMGFAYSHSLLDGRSGLLFHATFLEALRNFENLEHSSDPAWTSLTEYGLPPPLERCGDLRISWSFLLSKLVPALAPKWLLHTLGSPSIQDGVTWVGSKQRPRRNGSVLIPTVVRVVTISPALLNSVILVCRKKSSRLTALINLLAVRGLSKSLESRKQTYNRFNVETAIDMRGMFGKGRNDMANYVTAINEELMVHDSRRSLTGDDWALVQAMTQRLKDASENLADQLVALLKYVSNIRTWTTETAAEPVKGSLDTSNLGMFDGGRDGPETGCAIEEMCFSQSASGTGDPLNLNIASAKGGFLTMTMTWWPGILGVQDEGTFVEEILESIRTELSQLASGDSSA